MGKIQRAKQARKTLLIYKSVFGFSEPYRVIHFKTNEEKIRKKNNLFLLGSIKTGDM